ncbi:MAG TPA: hypothetical protein VFE38_09215 [Edaphobacter sp.]|nr:hypothetical protein [Edaphobacter sp.]
MLRRTELRELSLSRREALQMLAASPFLIRSGFRDQIERLPRRISIKEALDFHENQQHLHDVLMVVAAGWRSNIEAGEEDWFEELGAEEFEAEDFLEDFAEAKFQLWVR